MKAIYFVIFALSLNHVLASTECRLHIENFSEMIGSNHTLAENVRESLLKKDIELISKEEYQQDDFKISGLLLKSTQFENPAFMNFNLPRFKGIYSKELSFNQLCVVDIQRCPFISSNNELKGRHYQDSYTIVQKQENNLRVSKPHSIKLKFLGPLNWEMRTFDGSIEQESIAKAIAKSLPTCKQLQKDLSNN